MEERKPLISFRDADIRGGESTVLYGVCMDVFPGDFLYIVGKVGTGKTSVIRTMIAENPLSRGEGTVCGYNLRKMREKDIPYLRRHLGVIFQDFQLLMDRSVEENLYFVLKATGWKNSAEIDRRISEVLEAVGMAHKAHRMPHQLSGGEQQRVAIARALLNRPEVILADEPTGNLDNETAEGIMSLLTGINRERGTAVVMVTHNQALFDKYPGRVFVCKDESCTEVLEHGQETDDSNAGNSQEADALNTENGQETNDGNAGNSQETDEVNTENVPETDDGNAGNSQETDALNTENGQETDDGSPEDSREEENKQE